MRENRSAELTTKPHVRFDEKMPEIGYSCDRVTLAEETENTNLSL